MDEEKSYQDLSVKQMSKMSVDLGYSAMEVDKSEFAFHYEVVKAGVCLGYEDEYYTDVEYNPCSFHSLKFNRKNPKD